MSARQVIGGALAALALFAGAALAKGPAETWLGSWGLSPTAYNMTTLVVEPASADGTRPARTRAPGYAPLAPYANVTVRQNLRISADAKRIRVRFSNEFGAKPLLLGGAHIALAGENGAIVPGTDHALTFSGAPSVSVPPGAPIVSDPVDWALPAFSKLAVSVYFPDSTVPPAHTLYTNAAFASPPGNFLAAEKFSANTPARNGNFVSQIDIVPASAKAVAVLFGDSITEGVGSTSGTYQTYPDRLAERLAANRATRGWSLVNAGIGSNRLLHDTPSTNALSRFDRDVLSVPGVQMTIVMLGINDIQYGNRNAADLVTADQIIAAYRQLISRAHARGVKIIGATITAFEGSGDYTAGGEAVRQAANQFIRTSGAFDGVVDFDAALRDPAAPTKLQAAYDSGGHLHPNDAGYRAMGDAIDLKLFQAAR